MSYQMIDGIPVFGVPMQNAVDQMKNCDPDADRSALMADHHLGYAMPVGGVCAYVGKVSPSGVGYDISCGNKAVMTDAKVEYVRAHLDEILDEIVDRISFGVGRKNKNPIEHDLFTDEAWAIPAASALMKSAQDQLGTVGSGNHYVDLFVSEDGKVWIGCHFGSRGLGHKLATHYIKAGGGKDGVNVKPVLLNDDSTLGQEYIACMKLAGRYAYAGRDWVCSEVARILGATELESIHNHHNFAWEEVVNGEPMWVVRKGATPAWPGQKGFVGGSMGDDAVIIEGVDGPEAETALHSTIHGAGRAMSRTEAAGKRKGWHKGQEERSGGKISPAMMYDWLFAKGVTLRGGDVDEAPQAYKRISQVLEAHNQSIKVLHVLSPIGVCMAGKGVEDPFSD